MGDFIPAAPDARGRRRSRKIDRIVIHTAEGSFRGTVAWFQRAGRSPPTATHFVVSKTGEVVQMVLEKDKALHCGSRTEAGWNDRSIGIEHEDYAHDGSPPSETMLRASAALVRDICRRRRIPMDREHIIGHGEIPGVTHTDPGELWPWDRYMGMVIGLGQTT